MPAEVPPRFSTVPLTSTRPLLLMVPPTWSSVAPAPTSYSDPLATSSVPWLTSVPPAWSVPLAPAAALIVAPGWLTMFSSRKRPGPPPALIASSP